MGPDESELIRRAQRGDLAAYDALMERCVGRVRAFVALRAPQPHLVDELCHEAFVFAYEHLDDFTPGGDFAAWVRAIAGNLLRSRKQRHAREQRYKEGYARHREQLLENAAAADDEDDGEEAVVALLACLDRLGDKPRQVIELTYRHGDRAEAVAGALGRSREWVYQCLHRAREALRGCIEKRLAQEAS